jgi:hypothetical protein
MSVHEITGTLSEFAQVIALSKLKAIIVRSIAGVTPAPQ